MLIAASASGLTVSCGAQRLLEGKNTERGRRRTYKVRNNNPATVIQINMYCTTSGFVPKSILSSSRSATDTEKHQVGFEGSLHYYCGKSTVFCFAHLFFQGFNGYGTAYSCSRLLFYNLFFSHLQRKESESTAKNPMIVAYYLLLLRRWTWEWPWSGGSWICQYPCRPSLIRSSDR